MDAVTTDSLPPDSPSFEDDGMRSWLLRTIVTMSVLAGVSTGIRVYSRRLGGARLWLDDWMMFLTTLWSIALFGLYYVMYRYGMGLHVVQIEPTGLEMVLKLLLATEIFHALNMMLVKFSVLLVYLRTGSGTSQTLWISLTGFFVLKFVATFVILLGSCTPINAFWDMRVEGSCHEMSILWIGNAAATIVTNIMILSFVISQIKKLDSTTPRTRFFKLACGLGILVCFACARRTSYLMGDSSGELTYTLASAIGWAAIELTVAIVTADLLAMGHIWNRQGLDELPADRTEWLIRSKQKCGFDEMPSAIQAMDEEKQ